MRIRTIVLAAGVVGGLSQAGDAFVPRKGADAPFVTTGRAPRTSVHATYLDTTLTQHGLDRWHAVWDVDTDVPSRMWGRTAKLAGTVANDAAAESAAREFLATHLRTLAPGAAIGDFVLVANVLNPSGDLRTVAFEQRYGGVRVLDSGVSFAFKNDRLALVSSSAKPNVAIAAAIGKTLRADDVKLAATGWLATGGLTTRATAMTDRVIVPIVRPRSRAGLDITYRLADTVEVESLTSFDKWTVWVGADDGKPFARASRLMHNTGTVNFNTPDQSPTAGVRSDKAASLDTVNVDGANQDAGLDGVVTFNGGTATVKPSLTGKLVKVTPGSGTVPTGTFTLANNGAISWNVSGTEKQDAQLSAYVFANVAKQFAKTHYNATLPFVATQQLTVNVNVNGTCNAFWDPQAGNLNFFPIGGGCENTARINDVVYHEFGHGLHQNSVIPGVGQFDGGLSEGLADTNAVAITGDSGLGRGFQFTMTPLRELNPATKKVWRDGLEVHDAGEIIGETLWDLRSALQTNMGQQAGFDHFIKIYYSIMQRASDIPTTTYPEALLADDDDGDLTNGTPNQCAINDAFAAHDIADPSLAAGVKLPTRDNFTINLSTAAPSGSLCPGPDVTGVKVTWRLRAGATQVVDLVKSGDNWTGDIPTQPDGSVVEYQVTASLGTDASLSFPQNPADPFYQFYVGQVSPLKCFDFETGAADWTHTGTPTASDEWEAGEPKGLGGDPAKAHGGDGVFGIDLTSDGIYAASAKMSAISPEISLGGHKDARLQFYRWLNVEDGFFDHATVDINGVKVWANTASAKDPTNTGELNHTDKEWRFVDIDLSSVTDDTIKIGFNLQSDEGLDLGGWTLDDVCVVVPGPPLPVCGNGTVEDGEDCDDGNTTAGDGCSATCVDESGGGGGKGGGCCSTGTSPGGPLALGAAVAAMLIRRRRRA